MASSGGGSGAPTSGKAPGGRPSLVPSLFGRKGAKGAQHGAAGDAPDPAEATGVAGGGGGGGTARKMVAPNLFAALKRTQGNNQAASPAQPSTAPASLAPSTAAMCGAPASHGVSGSAHDGVMSGGWGSGALRTGHDGTLAAVPRPRQPSAAPLAAPAAPTAPLPSRTAVTLSALDDIDQWLDGPLPASTAHSAAAASAAASMAPAWMGAASALPGLQAPASTPLPASSYGAGGQPPPQDMAAADMAAALFDNMD